MKLLKFFFLILCKYFGLSYRQSSGRLQKTKNMILILPLRDTCFLQPANPHTVKKSCHSNTSRYPPGSCCCPVTPWAGCSCYILSCFFQTSKSWHLCFKRLFNDLFFYFKRQLSLAGSLFGAMTSWAVLARLPLMFPYTPTCTSLWAIWTRETSMKNCTPALLNALLYVSKVK